MKAVPIPAILPFVVVCSCASLSPQAKAIMDADDHLVANCKFLGNVHGSSGWGGLAGGVGVENAKNGARENAAELGATHVVWVSESGGLVSSGLARAYACAPSTQVASPGPEAPGSVSVQVPSPAPFTP
jgi:hypothetical protein